MALRLPEKTELSSCAPVGAGEQRSESKYHKRGLKNSKVRSARYPLSARLNSEEAVLSPPPPPTRKQAKAKARLEESILVRNVCTVSTGQETQRTPGPRLTALALKSQRQVCTSTRLRFPL